jgi:hypothetical protein
VYQVRSIPRGTPHTVSRLEHAMTVIPQQRDEVLPIGDAILSDQDGRHGISVRSQDGAINPSTSETKFG